MMLKYLGKIPVRHPTWIFLPRGPFQKLVHQASESEQWKVKAAQWMLGVGNLRRPRECHGQMKLPLHPSRPVKH